MPEKRCINCGLCINTTDTVSDLESDKKELLKQWIPEIEVLDTHPICQACFRKLEYSDRGAARSIGHPKVCIHCGRSTAKTSVLNPKQDLFGYAMGLARKNLPDSLKGVSFSQICYKCSRKYRAASASAANVTPGNVAPANVAPANVAPANVTPANVARPAITNKVWIVLPPDDPAIPAETADADKPTPQLNKPTKPVVVQRIQSVDKPTPQLNNSTKTVVVQRIQLNEYKRVKASSNKCVVGPNCEGELKPVPLRMRQTNLVRRTLYVPHGIKLCAKHSQLPPPSNVSFDHSFSGEEIADMLFLLQCFPPLEDNGVIDQDMCYEWLGVKYGEFKETLRKCGSRLQEAAGSAREARLAVAAYFLTRHRRRHDCHTVLASLLQCHPTEVHTLAKLAEDCLKNPQNGTEPRTDDDSQCRD